MHVRRVAIGLGMLTLALLLPNSVAAEPPTCAGTTTAGAGASACVAPFPDPGQCVLLINIGAPVGPDEFYLC